MIDISDAQVEQFWQDGATCVRGAIAPEWIERLRAGTEDVLAHPNEFTLNLGRGGGAFIGNLFMWTHQEDFRAFIFESPAKDVAARMLRTDRVRLYYDYLLVKEPGASNPTPWHHDFPYYPQKGSNTISLWIALDPVTRESGAVEYVKGSHRWGKLFRPGAFSGNESFDGTPFEAVPDVDNHRDKYDILSWDMQPGDCLVHHVLTLHGAPENRANIRRRGLAVRWQAGDVYFDPRPKTAPGLNKMAIASGLKQGDRFGGKYFPEFQVR